MVSRRTFLTMAAAGAGSALLGMPSGVSAPARMVMSVRGPVPVRRLGPALIHEHILVDFSGAEKIDARDWPHDKVIGKMLPFLRELRATGCETLFDCTPNFLGRDPLLLQKLSAAADLNIVTNTGYYGGSDHKFLPANAFTETAEQLSSRWIAEWTDGIAGTEIRPGFIKISVNPGKLSDISTKLIEAAALTHLKTGLTIASHTGPAVPAFEQLGILERAGVHPSAFIWVHAQNERDRSMHVSAAQRKCWVSLDSVNDSNVDDYVSRLAELKTRGQLQRVLISHDAGWYDPQQPDGGKVRGYTALFAKLVPALLSNGFRQSDIEQLLVKNPAEAFAVAVRRR